MLDSSERLDLVVRSLALVLVTTIITYAIYPYLYSLFYPLAMTEDRIPEGFVVERNGSGRVFKHVGVVMLDKPEDDPWGSSAVEIIPDHHSFEGSHTLYLRGASTVVTANVAAQAHSVLDLVTNITIVAQFTFTSQVTGSVSLSFDSTYAYTVFQIPSRTWLPNYVYRWRITIPWYDSASVKASLIVPKQNGYFWRVPMTLACDYWSGGQLLSSSSGLSFAKTDTILNITHLRAYITIAFDVSWIGRSVASCYIYTTYSAVISGVNQVLTNRQITSGRLYLLLLSFSPNLVVESGDQVTVEIYYVTPSNV